MAMAKIHVSKNAPAPIGPYSQAVEVNGLVFCSGQIPLDPVSGAMLGSTAAEQSHQVMKNIMSVLMSADLTLQNVVKTTIFLVDMADFQSVNEVYASYMGETKPARSTVAVQSLPRGSRVEIEVLAARF
jgi:2-iminobutanoate/2-iminopropanoate deaminase